ncbi:helix-turn-helix transcriptional regulator [Gudongella sp. SC589]|uniref:helix-turn-helix transcriptional regulator n=1 Tax=Gudongella sp. SC589 TaxID=3385990 RepID=UPI003904D6C4
MKTDRRLELLMMLFQADWLSADELAKEFNVTPKTIARDVQYLNDMGIPIHSKRGVSGGYKVDDEFKNKNKKTSLKSQEEILKKVIGTDTVSEEQVEYMVNTVEKSLLESSKGWLSFEFKDGRTNQIIEELHSAILNEREIQILLKGYEEVVGIPEKVVVNDAGISLKINSRDIKVLDIEQIR